MATVTKPTIAELRKQCNIDDTSYDDVLEVILSAATVAVSNDINRDLECVVDASGNLPAPIHQAILIKAATLFANRESVSPVSMSVVPETYHALICYYKCLGAREKYVEEEEEGGE